MARRRESTAAAPRAAAAGAPRRPVLQCPAMTRARWTLAGAALLALAAAAPKPAIVDLAAALDGRRVLVSFGLANAFDAEFLERAATGLPTGFVYRLELLRDRKRWWDQSVAEAEWEVVAMYNAVTREYLVNFKQDGKLVESRTLREAGDLERALTQFTAVAAFAADEVEPGERVLVRVQAKLGTRNWLGFIPTEIETSWATSNKLRLPVEQP